MSPCVSADHKKAVLLERRPTTWLHVQRPVEDQPGHVAQVRLPGPGLTERLLGQSAARGAVQWGQRGLILGGQEGPRVLPHQRLHSDALLQRCAGLRASVGPHRHLRPDPRCPAAWWVTGSSSRFLHSGTKSVRLFVQTFFYFFNINNCVMNCTSSRVAVCDFAWSDYVWYLVSQFH